MSAGVASHAASIVADLDIETPAGDRLSLRGGGGELRVVAASVGALWRTRRAAGTLLNSGIAPRMAASLAVGVDVHVGTHVVARARPVTVGGARLRLRWLALLRALFAHGLR